MRRVVILFSILVAFSGVSALIYDVENVNIIAFPNETLEYKLNITNNDTSVKNIYINKIFIDNTFIGKSVSVKPSINLVLSPDDSKVVDIVIPVSDDLAKGIYRTLYTTSLFVSYDGNVTDTIKLDAVILSKAIEPIELQNITLINPPSVSPLESFNLTITLLGNLPLVSPTINVIVSNDESVIFKQSFVKDLVQGINVFDRLIDLPNNTLPGTYDLLVKAELSGKFITQGIGSIIVEPYSAISASSVLSEDLFGKSVNKTLVNNGTEPVTVSVNYSASIIEPSLVSRALLIVTEGDRVISSEQASFVDSLINEQVTLQPGQSVELLIEFNYVILLLIPFVVVFGVIAWFFLTKRVMVHKEIIECKREGSELVVKVGIAVRNVSINSIKDVRVVEDLPVFAKKAGAFGSIKGEINRERGTITFHAGRLDPKEEILVSYKFKTDVELIGRVRLPPVTVKYDVNGKVQFTKSNTPIVHLIKGGQ